MAADFRVDRLLAALKCLQNERVSLERKLSEVRQRRKKADMAAEQASEKLHQVKLMHAKMTELSKVSKHKVFQTQTHITQLDKLNAGKRASIKQWNETIALMKRERTHERVAFEKRLNNLAKNFMNTKNFFYPEKVKAQEARYRELQQHYNIEIDNQGKYVQRLAQKLQQLKLKRGKQLDVNRAQQRSVFRSLLEEKAAVKETLHRERQRLAQLKQQVKSLKQQRAQLRRAQAQRQIARNQGKSAQRGATGVSKSPQQCKPAQQSKAGMGKPIQQPRGKPAQQPQGNFLQQPQGKPIQQLQGKPKPIQQLQGKPIQQLQGKPIQQLQGKPIQQQQGKPIQQLQGKPIQQPQGKFIKQPQGKPMQQQQGKPMQQQQSKLMPPPQSKPAQARGNFKFNF